MQAFSTGDVNVMDMMQARDERALRQHRLLQNGDTLVCLTMNIPGPRKVSPQIYIAFQEGKRQIIAAFPHAVLAEQVLEKTGFEACYLLSDEAERVKRVLCSVEDDTPLGRLFDIDVLTPRGEKLSRAALGYPPRKCFLCGKPAFACARSRTHSILEMTAEIERRITAFYREQTIFRLSRAAVEALEQEARTTPKPGLVDERNCGSHPDMSMEMLLRSAQSLKAYFRQCAQIGFDCETEEMFASLQNAGLRAEREMLSETNGINTHKGAIFSLGILCAAAASCAGSFQPDVETICRKAGAIARPSVERYFETLTEAHSFGEELYLAQGVRGIRGEAADSFPSLLAVWPTFKQEASALSLNEAGVRALIRLLSRIQDTTLVKRGGETGWAFVQTQARSIEQEHFQTEAILALDNSMIARNLTCGGCADLLACLYFLYAIV